MEQRFVNVKKASGGAIVRSANSKPFSYTVSSRNDKFGQVTAKALKESAEAVERIYEKAGD